MPRKKPEIRNLYYITHVDNVKSIVRDGILSHAVVEELHVEHKQIYDAAIVGRRSKRMAPDGQTLWHFANLYFQARNPMLYRVLREKGPGEVAVLEVGREALYIDGAFISVGNAAAAESEILPAKDGLKKIEAIWPEISSEWWRANDGSKRRIMAECLVPNRIPPELVHAVYVYGHDLAGELRSQLPSRISVIPQPETFFRPKRRWRVAGHLSLADGDMFFSEMQTLTISVNTVGVMGKGLASRAKWQFPDVYVAYQDACRRKLLRLGKPYLYKREELLDAELAEDPATLLNPNKRTWFLMFATKKHWRNEADIHGIWAGLQWVAGNAVKEGVESLALPALGCGLGKLEWKDVGPLMCQSLANLGIAVSIYLPREATIPDEFLKPEYLLKANVDTILCRFSPEPTSTRTITAEPPLVSPDGAADR